MSLAEDQRNTCQSSIRANKDKIRHYVELYGSLTRFKGMIDDANQFLNNIIIM